MTEISRFATHNEYPDQSVEGMDLRHLLHPSTNLAQHQQQGPMVLESANGVYIKDNQGKQYLEGGRLGAVQEDVAAAVATVAASSSAGEDGATCNIM